MSACPWATLAGIVVLALGRGGLGGSTILGVLEVPQREVLVAIADSFLELLLLVGVIRWRVLQRALAIRDR